MYKKRSDGVETKLTDEHVKKLDALGFAWKAKKDKTWQQKERVRKRAQTEVAWEKCFKDLVEFKEKYGKIYDPDLQGQ